MARVLTLIAAPGAAGLDDGLIAAARIAIDEAGAQAGAVVWLDPGRACDLAIEGDAPALEAALRARLGEAPIDVALQPVAGRRKALLVADMESTIVTREMLDELGALAGCGERIAAITARSMRGEVDFAQSLRERVALLTGQPAELLDRAMPLLELTAGARTLIRTLRAHGVYTALVSGGFDCFTGPVRAACGFDEDRANRLRIEAGRLTGRVAEPILDREGKLRTLRELAAARGLSLAATAAVGDGANDIPMLAAAGLGVAFRGKAAVRAAARVRLDHADLTGLLYLQGYRATEFHH